MELSELYQPKVSIVIPAYNASNYLGEAIDAALAQTYSNIEIIVVNDGSKDDGATRAVALSYGDKIRYFEKENGGSSSALNVGIANMTGEWFSWLSHDDLYHPEKVERQVRFLNELPEGEDKTARVLFCASESIDENGNVLIRSDPEKEKKMADFVNNLSDNACLIAEPTRHMYHGCGCLVHKSVFEKIGAFDEKLRLLNDVDLWFRIYAAGYKIGYLEDVLVQGRIHSKQVSRSIGFSYHNPEQDMYWARSLNWLRENRKDDSKLFVAYGCNAYLKTRNKEANEAFAYAKQLNPHSAAQLFVKRLYCVGYSKMRNFAKNIYIKFKMG